MKKDCKNCDCGHDCHCGPSKCLDIPHASIDTRFVNGKDELRCYPGAYVNVRDENATYHVSCPGENCQANVMLVAKTPIYRDDYNVKYMPRYRNNRVIDFLNNVIYEFDHDYDYRTITMNAPVED